MSVADRAYADRVDPDRGAGCFHAGRVPHTPLTFSDRAPEVLDGYDRAETSDRT
jgi:hypothetical protein